MKNSKRNKRVGQEIEPKQPPIIYPHGKPITRRDMLKAGVIPFAASVTMPTIYEWLTKGGFAHGAECETNTENKMVTFVHVSLAGGAAMAANFVPHGANGKLLPSYSVLGLGAMTESRLVKVFNNFAPFSPTSNTVGMLNGIRTGVGAVNEQKTIAENSSFVAIPVRSQDDSSMNKFDITGAVTKAGVKGISLPNLGTTGSITGGRHLPAFVPPPAPLVVNNTNDLANAVSVAGSLGSLSTNQKVGLFRMINKLTSTQKRTLASMSGGDQVAALTGCASQVNQGLVGSGTTGTNPNELAGFANVWGINNNTAVTNQNFVFATLVYNALKGNAGTVNISLGGYDYHGNQRTNTDAQDNQAGLVVGRVLQSAAVMDKPIFIMVSSDGAVGSRSSDADNVNFTADRGSGGVVYMIAYDPNKKAEANGFQVGQFTNGQAADDRFITGDSPELAGAAVFANYMSFNNKLGEYDKIIPRSFSPDQLDQVVKIFRKV